VDSRLQSLSQLFPQLLRLPKYHSQSVHIKLTADVSEQSTQKGNSGVVERTASARELMDVILSQLELCSDQHFIYASIRLGFHKWFQPYASELLVDRRPAVTSVGDAVVVQQSEFSHWGDSRLWYSWWESKQSVLAASIPVKSGCIQTWEISIFAYTITGLLS
jgi:hypothetical protein